MFERRRILPGWERIEITWHVMQGGHHEAFSITHWVYSTAELRSMLHAAGCGRPVRRRERLHVIAMA